MALSICGFLAASVQAENQAYYLYFSTDPGNVLRWSFSSDKTLVPIPSPAPGQSGTLFADAGNPDDSYGVAYKDNYLYVARYAAGNIVRFDTVTGAQDTTWSVSGVHPYYLTMGPDGNLYVGDVGSWTISKIDIATQTATAVLSGQYYRGIGFDSMGRAYTMYGQHIYRYTISGTTWTQDSSFGADVPSADWAFNLEVDSTNNKIYVATYDAKKIYRFSTIDGSQDSWVRTTSHHTIGLDLSPDGRLAVTGFGGVSIFDVVSDSPVQYFDAGSATSFLVWTPDPTIRPAVSTFSPAGGVTNPLDVTISSSTAGATIWYTMDGTEPSESNPTATSIPSGGTVHVHQTVTIKARAIVSGMASCYVSTASYAIYNDGGDLILVPAVQGSVSSDASTGFSSYLIAGRWSSTGAAENVSYVKFNLPPSVDKIRSLILKGTNSNQYNWPYVAGIDVYRVADDSWNSGTVTSDWPCVTDSCLTGFYPSNELTRTLPINFSVDLSSWLSASGEGAGQPLSIKIKRTGDGTRGALLSDLRLVVSYLDRGHRVIADRGLQIQAQVFPAMSGGFDTTRWAASNFTTVNLQWGNGETIVPSCMGAAPGLPWGRWGTGGDPFPAELPYVSNMISFQYSDEISIAPTGPEAEIDYHTYIQGSFNSWHAGYPDVICFTNQAGMQNTAADLESYQSSDKPDMLMFDTYPFNGLVLGGSPTKLYEYMQKYRIAGLKGNDGTGAIPIPYGLYLQCIAQNGHQPTGSEMRLNQFAAWAFGYKFASAFVYDNPDSTGVTPTLFSGTGTANPTAAFTQIAETNRQSRNLGPALVRLLSTDLRMIMGQHKIIIVDLDNETPNGITAGISGADTYLTGISATNSSGNNANLRGDVIAGFFKLLRESDDGEAYSNEKYFMVVNGLSDANATAAQTQQTIRLTFNFGSSNINSLQRLSRTTGTVGLVPLVSDGGGVYHLDLTLDGGTGDLFKYNTGAPFVGVQAAVVPALAVSPETQTVPKEAGTASFTINNNGTGTMAWTAQVTSGSDWLSITSGSSGTNSGTIGVSFTKNAVPDTSRTATIQITAAGSTGSPCMVTVVQLAPVLIPGDANKDGSVDVGDLGILAANYGGSNKSWSQGDFNGDKLVDVGDLGILAAHYGTNASSADWSRDYAQAFGTTVAEDDTEDIGSSMCSGLGLPLVAGLILMGLMLVKLEE
jgi:hypothetical protein